VFCGRHLLAAKLRPANIDASAGSIEEVARIVARIRQRWPNVRILLRADSGFARDALMAWCETNGVDFLFGLAKNARLNAEIESELAAAQEQSQKTGKPARRFKDFTWRTRSSWSRARRVVAKAEWTEGKANPRFVVTSLSEWETGSCYLYEKIYCARGEMENRIKECQLDLGACPRAGRRPDPWADRTSAHTMRANQLRLWFASMAYVLIAGLPNRPGPYSVRPRLLRHHPPQTVEDRSAGAHQRAPYQARHALGLLASGRVPCRLPRAHRHRDRLMNQRPRQK
jgi:hypothetical protein